MSFQLTNSAAQFMVISLDFTLKFIPLFRITVERDKILQFSNFRVSSWLVSAYLAYSVKYILD